MNREPDDGRGESDEAEPGGDGPASRDAEFERIVAAWRDEGSVPDWPSDPAPTATAGVAASGPTEPEPPSVHRPGPSEDPDDDHYHPPEPPPLPRPGPPAVVGGGLIVLGLVLIAVPETLGLPSLYGLPLGLLGIAAGLTWLVMRMWPSQGADDHHDGDDGAVL